MKPVIVQGQTFEIGPVPQYSKFTTYEYDNVPEKTKTVKLVFNEDVGKIAALRILYQELPATGWKTAGHTFEPNGGK